MVMSLAVMSAAVAEADEAVGECAGDLVEHRTHGQRHGFVAFACFQLAVFNGVLKAHDHGHLNLGLRQVEQH